MHRYPLVRLCLIVVIGGGCSSSSTAETIVARTSPDSVEAPPTDGGRLNPTDVDSAGETIGADAGVVDGRADGGSPSGPVPSDFFDDVPPYATGEQTVTDPFVGVRLIARETTTPRPLRYWITLIDLSAPGVSATLTTLNGDAPRETTRQTTKSFLEQVGAQLAINAHFFSPWPPEDLYADLKGLAVSDGIVVSEFEPQFPVGLAWTSAGTVSLVRPVDESLTGVDTDVEMVIDDAVGAFEVLVDSGQVTADWEALHPRTGLGVTVRGHLIALTVDGRQDGSSEGMTTPEMATILLEFGAWDAVNLDGGGSTTLVVADPEPRVVNTPVGYAIPTTERDNGSNLAFYATPYPPSR